MRRFTAAVSVGLLLLVGAVVAEASLLALLLLFASVLRLNVAVEIGANLVRFGPFNLASNMQVAVANGGTIASFLLTLASGIGAAAYRYRCWVPAS